MDDIPVTYSNRANGCYVSLRGEGLGEQAFSFEVNFGCVSSWKNRMVQNSNSKLHAKTNLDTKNTNKDERNSILQTFLVRVHVSVPGCSSYLGVVFD